MSDHHEEEKESSVASLLGAGFAILSGVALIVMMGYVGASFIKASGVQEPTPEVKVAAAPAKAAADQGGAVAAAAPATTSGDAAEVTITCIAGLKYDTTEFKVKAGQLLKLTVKNPDLMPHNLVVIQDGQANAVGMAGMQAGPTNDYIPQSDAIIKATKLLQPSDEDTIEVTFDSAGTYQYICTFPGHFGVMNGKIIVE
ncbi:MAG: plastocyanin/azurin family copper-binding protein [Verrucomicrobiota bacterium]